MSSQGGAGGDSGASGQGGEGGDVAGAAGAAGDAGGGGAPSECSQAIDCTDSDACTADTCNSSGACVHAPSSGETCELFGGGTGVCSTGACVPPVCGNNAVEPGEECDGGNTDDLDGCNSKCQSEASAGPGLALALVDNGYTGTLASMVCVDLPVGTKGDGVVDSVKVRVAMTHTFVGDLVLKVVSPSNTVVTLVSRPGVTEPADDGMSSGGDSSNLAIGFPISFVTGGAKSAEDMGNTLTNAEVVCQEDAACIYAPAAGSATASSLSDFIGQTAVGTWRFCAADGLTGDLGSIDFVRLSILQ
jgi:cysteine-rich repeat protein